MKPFHVRKLRRPKNFKSVQYLAKQALIFGSYIRIVLLLLIIFASSFLTNYCEPYYIF